MGICLLGLCAFIKISMVVQRQQKAMPVFTYKDTIPRQSFSSECSRNCPRSYRKGEKDQSLMKRFRGSGVDRMLLGHASLC